MYTGMLHTHKLVVTLFLLIYLIKTVLLLLNKRESLVKFIAKTKMIEMIVSVLFLATGIFLASKSGNVGTWLWVKIGAIAVSIPLAVMGFKNQNKGLAIISFLLIVYSYGISETKSPTFKKQKAEILAGGDTMVLGQDVYTNLCQNCHGADGKLMLSGAKDLSISMLTKEEQILIITKGKNAMAAYESQLSEQQIEAVVTYIETLKTK
jgi:mono/diheme cytochrome c family protein